MFRFKILGSVRLDRRNAGQIVIQPRGQCPRRFTHRSVTRRQSRLEPECAVKNERYRHQRQKRQLAGQRKEHCTDHQRAGKHLDQIIRTAIQEALHLVDILIQHRHQITGAVPLEIGQLQLLHMTIRIHAHVVLQVLRQIAPLQFVQIFES